MPKTISDTLFHFNPHKPDGGSEAYISVYARDLDLKESWFRDSIASNPDMVIFPCANANLTDEQWYFWEKEFSVKTRKGNTVGKIDVLLISESGRIGIVETKLAYNRERRRDVLAQILDYAVHLREMSPESLPGLPNDENGDAVVGFPNMAEHLADGDFLLIVAGDELDERAVRLSAAILGDHQINPWDLAMIDLSIYQKEKDMDGPGYLIVPALRVAHVAVPRHIVRVIVQGDYTGSKVIVEPDPGLKPVRLDRKKWNIDQFYDELEKSSQPSEWIQMGKDLVKMTDDHNSLSFSLGTGKIGSLTLKRNGNGLIEFYVNGQIRFRKRRFKLALGNRIGQEYEGELSKLFTSSFDQSDYPHIKKHQVIPVISEVLNLIKESVKNAEETEAEMN